VRSYLLAAAVSVFLLAGCGVQQIEVPNELRNGPAESVSILQSMGFRVDYRVNGRTTPPSAADDQLRDGRYCHTIKQTPQRGLAHKGSTVRLDVRCR
jgi:hypothetical protein